jgi:beta-galactosidase
MGTVCNDTFISEEVAVNIKTKLGENSRLVTTIFDAEGYKLNSEESTVQFGKEFDQNIKVEKPKLWSPETSYL